MRRRITVRVIKDNRREKWVLRWTDRSGRARQQNAEGKSRRAAEREAARLEAQLTGREGVLWDHFCERYRRDYLAALSDKSRNLWATVVQHVENDIRPHYLEDIDSSSIASMSAGWRREGLSEATIGTYLRTLSAALSVAVDLELLDRVPTIRKPKQRPGMSKLMRSRPITNGEFKRIRSVVAKCRPPAEVPLWRSALDAMWLGGFRVGELLRLGWDTGDMRLHLEPYPHCVLLAEAHKSRRDEVLPITPDFAEWASKRKRTGLVVPLPTARADTISKRISEFGEAAGVKVDDEKYASAHDLRRAFATRWEPRVSAETLRLLMRHASISTTHAYYVHHNAADVWRQLKGQER